MRIGSGNSFHVIFLGKFSIVWWGAFKFRMPLWGARRHCPKSAKHESSEEIPAFLTVWIRKIVIRCGSVDRQENDLHPRLTDCANRSDMATMDADPGRISRRNGAVVGQNRQRK